MSIYSIYKFTNLVNGKVYIGQTSKDPAHRKKNHVADALNGSNLAFHKAIRKYGIENFSFEVIVVTCDETAVNELERMMIREYNSCTLNESSNGYNMTRGGDGVDSETTRQINLARVEAGTHPWAGERGRQLHEARITAGTHNFAGDNGSALQKARVSAGTHNMQGQRGTDWNNARIAAGTHNWVGEKAGEISSQRQKAAIAEGNHVTQKEHVCPHCMKQGKGPVFFRWHFTNCKNANG